MVTGEPLFLTYRSLFFFLFFKQKKYADVWVIRSPSCLGFQALDDSRLILKLFAGKPIARTE